MKEKNKKNFKNEINELFQNFIFTSFLRKWSGVKICHTTTVNMLLKDVIDLKGIGF